jgi:thymidylate synthase
MKFDGTEVPILTKKKIAWKLPIEEILAFWQQKTNSFEYFHEKKIRFWDEWEIKEGKWAGTIGPSYGYQMGKKVRLNKMGLEINGVEPSYLDQVDYLLYELKNNPSSRRHVTSLWNIEDLDEMALNPCVWNTQWIVQKGKLHLIVGVRSNDMALGNPFNVFQYYVLQRMIAQVTKYDIGTLTFNINNAHVYERHVDGLMEQMQRQEFDAPTLWVNPDIKNFYDFTIDDFKLENYQCGSNIPFEIAI